MLSLCIGILTACGGGGGGTTGTAGGAGSFTLSTNNISFSAKHFGPLPVAQTVTMHITTSGATTAGAGYANGETPAGWLGITAAGSGSDYTFTLTVNATGIDSATYSTVVTFGTADASNNILQTQTVQVSYTLRDGLTINANSASATFTVGDSAATESVPFMVTSPANLQWTAQSDSPWLSGPSGAQHGSGSFSAAVNMNGVGAGTHTGKLTLTNSADPTDTASLTVNITMVAPTLSGAPASITVGGATGLDLSAKTVNFSINTGQNAFAWTATATTSSGGSWLSLSASSGMVSASNATFTVNANAGRSLLAAGSYQGQIQLQSTVNGVSLVQNIPVTLNVDPNRLVANAIGVAFSSFPSRSVLTRTLGITNTWGITGVHWRTQSDQNWLTATPSGTTGSALVLTANPTGLAPGQYTAHLTISSPDTGVSNQETVRVGLTVGTADPAALLTPSSTNSLVLVTSPVEPVVFVSTGTANAPIFVYDLNTGALLHTFTTGFTTPGSLAISGDGLTLYVLDDTSGSPAIRALDAATGALQNSFPAVGGLQSPQIVYGRPAGHPVLFCSRAGGAIDLVTGANYSINNLLGWNGSDDAMAVSPDQSTLYQMLMGLSPANIGAYRVAYSTLPGVGLSATLVAQNDVTLPVVPANGKEIAVSPDGMTVYTASGAPYDFEVFNTGLVRQTPLPAVAYPTSVTTSWNGLIAGGSVGYNAAGDIWIYDTRGNLLEQTHQDPNGNLGINDRGLKFSGDGTRLASIGGAGLQIYATPVPPP